MKNIIFIGTNDPVEIDFTDVDLTLFTDIKVTYGSDERSLTLNPESVEVVSATQLNLYFNDTDERVSKYWEVIGIDALHPDGQTITNSTLANLGKAIVSG